MQRYLTMEACRKTINDWLLLNVQYFSYIQNETIYFSYAPNLVEIRLQKKFSAL
jgi:hypothetical protein